MSTTKNPSPLDTYLLTKTAAYPATFPAIGQQRTDEDHALVSQWQGAHQNGQFDPELTHQAIQRFQPTIQTAIKKYKGPMTGDALGAHAKNLAIEALQTYNPEKGAAFNTHLTNTLQRLHRKNAQAQGAYIPESQAAYLGPAQQAHDEFLDDFGRPPTQEEHEQRLNEMLPAHRRLEAGGLAPILALQRNSVASSNFEAQPSTYAHDLEAQNVSLARQDLDPADHGVYDAIYRDKVTSTGDIAKRLGLSDPAVSRAKGRIEQTIRTTPTPGARRSLRK